LRKVRDESQGARTKKTFDPSSQSLGALKKAKMAAKKGKGAAAITADDSSDDDSSSSSSDDD
jgi:hypothetical protein